VDRVLFDKSRSTLIQFPIGLYPYGVGGSYTVPAGVANIGPFAFDECFGLEAVTIPSSVTNISYGAFVHCSLVSVTIPGSVTSIGIMHSITVATLSPSQ
jgi:hypothetical protein